MRITNTLALSLLLAGLLASAHWLAQASEPAGGAIPTSTVSVVAETATPPPQLSTPTPTYCANPFVDIDATNPLYRYVLALACAGVVSGYDATHFGPSLTASRGQFAKILARGLGLSPATPTSPSFSDVPANSFAFPYVEALRLHPGVLDGYSGGPCTAAGVSTPCFQPNRTVSRAEAVKVIVKARGWVYLSPQAGYSFADVRPDHWAYVYVEAAYYHEVISGAGGYFEPLRSIRRDEISKIVLLGVNNN